MRQEHPVHKGASPQSVTDTIRIGHTRPPSSRKSRFPDNAALIDTGRQAGAGDAAADCINNNTYTATVAGMADAANVTHTPTVRINGQDYELSTPDALVARIKQVVGPVPGIDTPATSSTEQS